MNELEANLVREITTPVADVRTLSIRGLLSLQGATLSELRRRGVLRSGNSPPGDFAEYLFCRAFSWNQAPKSEKGYDATDGEGRHYQIKSRMENPTRSRELSTVHPEGFDFLAAVLFDREYDVLRAAIVPSKVVEELTTLPRRRFTLSDRVWDIDGVVDVTKKLRRLANRLPVKTLSPPFRPPSARFGGRAVL
ncbi:MAG: hypothetical protein OXH09_03420 [Gammaproteobacteria bacterium]|nr:hypothetical protein [Gammaproteobacteria bacterium]